MAVKLFALHPQLINEVCLFHLGFPWTFPSTALRPTLVILEQALDLDRRHPYDRAHCPAVSTVLYFLNARLPMRRFLLGLLPQVLAGCPTTTAMLVGAPALLSKSEFDERRTETKQQIEKGLISKETGETNCRQMLNGVDRNHAAPPPVDPAICEFGSFADKRHELTRSVESGALTPELWVIKCRQLAGQPSGKDVCRYDPFADRITQWRRLVDETKASKEGAEMDCRNYVKQVRQHPIPGPEITEDACKL